MDTYLINSFFMFFEITGERRNNDVYIKGAFHLPSGSPYLSFVALSYKVFMLM